MSNKETQLIPYCGTIKICEFSKNRILIDGTQSGVIGNSLFYEEQEMI
jgi:hypothetical protein